ncbi:sugar ABC transporter substrate-binding protein [Salinibacterium sp. ZJ77]|uniref:ABC transporter substrate-binding protein n=1 Tax=Salinibacterium sp. ZJ77 TaxID=2708337 RepID=UPI001424596E|nr:sugar ABC transporter substrate-binding protein [Salinibacterium sp. ZJ77]
MKPSTQAILGALAAALALTLAACTNAVSPNAPTDPETAKIGLLLPDSVTARYESGDRPFFEERIAELCAECRVLYANADGDAAKQQQQAEAMLSQGVSVLVLDPFDGQAAASIVGLAQVRGVPVVAYDRLIHHADIAYYVSFDNEKVGRLQAESLLAKLDADGVTPADGGILMVNGSPTDNNASEFKRGALAVFADSGFEVLASYDTPGWDPAKAQDWVSGQIIRFGTRIVGVYAANDPTAGGAIASLKAAGVNPVPPVTGQDAELAGLQRILSGDQYMTVYKALRPQAHHAADVAIELANGGSPRGETEVSVAGGSIPTTLLDPVAVTRELILSTVMADGFYTVPQLCTPAYTTACAEVGIR